MKIKRILTLGQANPPRRVLAGRYEQCNYKRQLLKMKYFLVIVLAGFLLPLIGDAQSCLPNGIVFSTQNQIDSFQINYPGCTFIEGNVEIGSYWSVSDITNLNGLLGVTTIGGYLEITNCDALLTLEGLDSLIDIGQHLDIRENCSLQNLSGLNNLYNIGSALIVMANNNLMNITSLSTLTSIDSSLWICNNSVLTNLSGLNNITSVQGDLFLSGNKSLPNLSGLDNLTMVGGDIRIEAGDSLISLNGLENLLTVGGDLRIGDPFTLNPLLQSIAGLSGLMLVGGNFLVAYNEVLPNLNGLESLSTIGGTVNIYVNETLHDLNGLSNLTSIGGTFQIYGDYLLTSIEGLNNLVSIGGDIVIKYNTSLPSLSGLDNINPNSISNLTIAGNTLLTECEIQSICDYLSAPGGTIEIHDNATGCNSQEEVENACESIGIDESSNQGFCSIYPNPAKEIITITCPNGEEVTSLNIYNSNGQLIKTVECKSNSIDISSLTPGIYLIEYAINGKYKHERVAIY